MQKRADRAIKNQFIIICKVQTSKDRKRDPKTGRPSERERERKIERENGSPPPSCNGNSIKFVIKL